MQSFDFFLTQEHDRQRRNGQQEACWIDQAHAAAESRYFGLSRLEGKHPEARTSGNRKNDGLIVEGNIGQAGVRHRTQKKRSRTQATHLASFPWNIELARIHQGLHGNGDVDVEAFGPLVLL